MILPMILEKKEIFMLKSENIIVTPGNSINDLNKIDFNSIF